MKGFIPSLAIVAAGATGGALAQTSDDPTATTAEKIRRVVVYGTDPCPPSSGDEIVVCARKPETERYRIPEELRDEAREEDPANTSWAVRAESLEFVGEAGIQSCSTVGPGGFTGCWAEMMRRARAERRQAAAEGPEL
jgi:hypothetical protein